MRVLGVDLGTKRTGLAISDAIGLVARPLDVLRVKGAAEPLVAALRAVVTREEVDAIVVGLPRRMGGEEGPEAERARAVAEALQAALGLPVELWDERLSSVEANERLIEQGLSPEERRRIVDKVAAALILQDYLDARRGPST